MYISTTAEIWRDGELILSGRVDLQSGPRGWNAAVIAETLFSQDELPSGRFQLRLGDATSHDVRLISVRPATHEARFGGIGQPPALITEQ